MLHALIINPMAGKRDRTAELASEARRLFGGRGLDWTVEPTRRIGHARELAEQFAALGREVTLYACGGDGTLGEVAQGLAGAAHCRLAPVPIGTGNDFVRCFAPDAAERFSCLEQLLDGTEQTIDLLRVGDRVCINIASAGFDAAVAQSVAGFKRWPLVSGEGAYALSVARCLLTATKNRLGLELDGVALPARDYLFVVVANGSHYGGGFYAAPPADLTDGLLDVVCVDAIARARMLRLVGLYKRGEHLAQRDIVRHHRCKRLRLLTERAIPFNIDGEIVTLHSPEIQVEPGALRLAIPGCFAAPRLQMV